MSQRLVALSLAVFCFCCLPAVHAASAEKDLEVSVTVEADDIHIDINMLVDAKPREVWAVLTDFDHMADFISNLSSSRVLSRAGNTLMIEQKGKTGVGPLSISFESVREMNLSPFERIRSHLVSGSMKKLEGLTKLTEESGKTRVQYHADAVSGSWLPTFAGRGFIEDETLEQFAQMRQEVMRRKQAGIAP